MEAAIECIVEEGFYRATSNRIAERAGVTWGVIQYHFGSREALMLAACSWYGEQYADKLVGARIEGDTLVERLDSMCDVVWSHMRRPEYIATIEVLLNLGRDPKVKEQTLEAAAELYRNLDSGLHRLVRQAVPSGAYPRGTGQAVYRIIRALAIGEEISDNLPRNPPRSADSDRPIRRFLIDSIAAYLDQHHSSADTAAAHVSR